MRAGPREYLLRTSVEFASPQLTLEELQGILVARLLSAAAAERAEHPSPGPRDETVRAIARRLSEPMSGPVRPFLLNVDDIEADRYSVNPLRASIVASGQSAFAVHRVTTASLTVDAEFVQRYRGALVTDRDIAVLQEELTGGSRYTDLVERVKYRELERLSEEIGFDLALPSIRMPLSTLEAEAGQGPIHGLVRAAHRDLEHLREVYRLFGRELGHRKTLLPAVPHAAEGFASKRCGSGRVRLDSHRFLGADVRFQPADLYPNEVDRSDVARAVADARFSVPSERFETFDYRRTPASPQFALYMIASPEDGALWHGLGRFAGTQIVQSYASFRRAFTTSSLFDAIDLPKRPDPLQFDLVAEAMLRHPERGNIDASTDCVSELVPRLVDALKVRPVPASMIGGGTTALAAAD